MACQHLIAIKVKLNGLGGYRKDIMRQFKVKKNPNIDLARSHLNHSIEDLSPENLAGRVRKRIRQLQLKKRPRSDAVGLEDIVIGASAEFMLNLNCETREKYFADSLHFFQKRYGKENVMYCHCHLDEHNPHIHIGIVPATPDGRLSAKSLFSPKTLEQLQTDFHEKVAIHYGLERGEHHAKKYLPLQQFKANQAKIKAEQFTNDLQIAEMTSQKIKQAIDSAHFASSGILFKSEDHDRMELSTPNFLIMKRASEESAKAAIVIDLLSDDLKKAQHETAIANADSQYYSHLFYKLEKETKKYTDIPKAWRREFIDHNIDDQQKNFTAYCHDLNRAIIRVFIATHGNFDQTNKILHDFIQLTEVKDVERHISAVIYAALRQHKKNRQPNIPQPSWKPPKPEQTDYKQPDEDKIVQLKLSRVPDIDWNLINWDLLDELTKDEIRNKKIVREL